jgi:hypothetical protein
MCVFVGATRLQVKSQNTSEEDTMHPDIANQVAGFRHAELVAEAAHQRLAREAKQARTAGGQRVNGRRWRVLTPSRALAAE